MCRARNTYLKLVVGVYATYEPRTLCKTYWHCSPTHFTSLPSSGRMRACLLVRAVLSPVIVRQPLQNDPLFALQVGQDHLRYRFGAAESSQGIDNVGSKQEWRTMRRYEAYRGLRNPLRCIDLCTRPGSRDR